LKKQISKRGLVAMQIFIPTPLRAYAEGKDAVEVNAATISEALAELTRTYPGLRKHLFTEEGKLRSFVNLYWNDEDVRYLPQKEQTAVSGNDTLTIIPSIAGGIAVEFGSLSPYRFAGTRKTGICDRQEHPWHLNRRSRLDAIW
jgi:sulfur-carrier protein